MTEEIVKPPVSVHEAVLAVMRDVGVVGKTKMNAEQHFKFRSVEDIVDAVAPAMRAHGVLVLPDVQSLDVERYQGKTGTVMKNVTVKCSWVIVGPAGDRLPCPIVTYGEASDVTDKATSKAQSVAWRTALVEIFAIATGVPPDGANLERGYEYAPDAHLRRQHRQRDTRASQDPPDLVRARDLVLKEASRVRPDLSEADAIAWIGAQLREQGLKSDSVTDLRKLAADLHGTKPVTV